MVKLLALDVDGTLLPAEEKHINDNILKLIKDILDNNVRIVIASGRSYVNLYELFENLSERLIFVCHDGAITIENGKKFNHKSISKDTIKRFAYYYSNFFGAVAFYSENKCYVIGHNDMIKNENIVPIKNYNQIKEQIYKIGLYSDSIIKIMPEIPKDIRVCSNAADCIEYVSLIADKGAALSEIQSRFYMTKLDTAALGNDINDIRMLKNAKYSAVVSSAPNDVKLLSVKVVENAESFLAEIAKNTKVSK